MFPLGFLQKYPTLTQTILGWFSYLNLIIFNSWGWNRRKKCRGPSTPSKTFGSCWNFNDF